MVDADFFLDRDNAKGLHAAREMNDGGGMMVEGWPLTSRILYHPFPPVIGDTGTRSFVFVSPPCLCASSDPAAAGERVV